MKTTTFILACSAILFFSCNSKKISDETYAEYQKKGNEISAKAQSLLLANVGQAIQTGGPVYALEFCNLKASSIVDSLNQTNNCIISRLSDKNRNLENKLKNETEKNIWGILKAGTLSDTVLLESNKLIFYKAIKTGLPACLKCHGDPSSDIDAATIEKIQNLYPADLATGYKLNDFRGLWKIEFPVD